MIAKTYIFTLGVIIFETSNNYNFKSLKLFKHKLDNESLK